MRQTVYYSHLLHKKYDFLRLGIILSVHECDLATSRCPLKLIKAGTMFRACQDSGQDRADGFISFLQILKQIICTCYGIICISIM